MRWSLLAAMAGATILALYVMLIWLAKGVTEDNAHRIVTGMTRQEVEAILGPPNYAQARDQLEKLTRVAEDQTLKERALAAMESQRTAGEFWDAFSFGRWGRYVAVTVYYDENDRVSRKQVSTSYRGFLE
jgi:LmbE family N-acetylglucosaminyl deacetylase